MLPQFPTPAVFQMHNDPVLLLLANHVYTPQAFNSHQERAVCALGMESIQTLTQVSSITSANLLCKIAHIFSRLSAPLLELPMRCNSKKQPYRS